MKPQFFVLMSTLVLSSCLPIRSISSTHQYNVYIESGFTDDQRQLILQSMREWETATNQTVTLVEVQRKDRSQALITVHPSTREALTRAYKEDLIGRCNFRGADSNNYIATDLDDRDFYQTSLHEFGHSLGLDHDEDESHQYQTTMMRHTDDASTHLKCLDMRAFCKVWKCNPNFLPPCETRIRP